MQYFWWSCRGNLKLITLGSERVKSWTGLLKARSGVSRYIRSLRLILRLQSTWNRTLTSQTFPPGSKQPGRESFSYSEIQRTAIWLIRLRTTGPEQYYNKSFINFIISNQFRILRNNLKNWCPSGERLRVRSHSKIAARNKWKYYNPTSLRKFRIGHPLKQFSKSHRYVMI